SWARAGARRARGRTARRRRRPAAAWGSRGRLAWGRGGRTRHHPSMIPSRTRAALGLWSLVAVLCAPIARRHPQGGAGVDWEAAHVLRQAPEAHGGDGSRRPATRQRRERSTAGGTPRPARARPRGGGPDPEVRDAL